MIVIRVISISGLIRVVGIVADHHVVSPGQRRTDGDLLLGPIAAALRPRARAETLVAMLAVLVASHEPLERGREPAGLLRLGPRPGRRLLLLLLLLPLGHRVAWSVRVPRVSIANDGDRSRLHLLLRCAPAPRGLILRALA